MTFVRTKRIRIFAAFVAAASILALSSCEGEEEETTAETDELGNPIETVAVTDESGNQATDEEGNPLFEPVIEEKTVYKAGFIYSGRADSGATNAVFENARAQVEKTLGMETCYIENVLVADFSEAVAILKEDGCNIIVSCSPKFANSAAKEAKTYDNTYYLSFGAESSSGVLGGFGGELYQSSAVCGIVAAHNTENNVIGVVADPGSYNAYGVVDGFIIGASEIWGAYTDVRLDWVWSYDEEATRKAVDDLITQGCDVIMCYTESKYAAEYCSTKNVGVIANCHDLPDIAPDNYITGYFFKFDNYLIDQLRAIENENFVPKVYNGDIGSGVVRLVDFGSYCKEGSKDIGDRYYNYIKEHKALVFSGELRNTKGVVLIEKGQSMSFENILKINWLVQGVRYINNFTDVTQNPISSTFEIKR